MTGLSSVKLITTVVAKKIMQISILPDDEMDNPDFGPIIEAHRKFLNWVFLIFFFL